MAGQEYFGIGIDTKKLEQDAEKAKKAFQNIGKEAEKQSSIIDKVFSGSTLSTNLEKEFKNIDRMSIEAFGGISENAQRMVKEIQEDTMSLSNVERMMSGLNKAYENGTISQTEYINAASRLEVLHRNISSAIQDNERALKSEMQVVDKLADDSMTALQAKVALLTTEYMKLSKVQRESAQGEGLLKNISEINRQLQNAQITMGKYGATAISQFNTLGFSIQQIARELPALTISPQMFFLAISNNLPIFTDALAKARNEFNAMTAAGQKAVPVWKQVAKSLVSWQTALSLLPTLLIVYSDEIGNFVKNLFSAKSALNDFSGSMKDFNSEVIKQQTNANMLFDTLKKTSEGTEQRRKAIDQINDAYGKYLPNLLTEKSSLDEIYKAYKLVNTAILENAALKAQQKEIDEYSEKSISRQTDLIDDLRDNLKGLSKNISEEDLNNYVLSIRKSIESYLSKGYKTNETAAKVFSDILPDKKFLTIREVDLLETLKNYSYEIAKYYANINAIRNKYKSFLDNPVTGVSTDEIINTDSLENQTEKVKDFTSEIQRILEENEERKIEIEKQGADKEIALINLRYQRQVDAVKKLQEDLKAAQGGTLTGEQQNVFNTAISGLGTIKDREVGEVQNRQLEAERKAMQEYLIEYGDYWDKRKNLAEKYQDEIAKATTEGEIKSLQAEMTQALAKLDDEAQKKTSIITQLFGNMATKSVSEMRRIADEAEQLLSFIEGGEYQKDNAFGITEEQFKVLSQSPDKLESIKNEIANVRNEADTLEPVFERIKNSLVSIFNQKPGDNLNISLQKLNSDLQLVMQAAGFLSDSFSKLGDAFGGGAFSGIAEGIDTAMGVLNSGMQGAQAGAMFGPIGAAAGAAVGVVSSLASAIAGIHDKKNERQIQRLQDQIDTLSKSYDNLGKEIEKSYSTDAAGLIEQQNEALEKQKELIEQQIREEEDKKDTDNNRIKQWREQIDAINEQLEENKQKAIDAVTGTDLMSAIDEFAQAYADAWANGTSAAEASTKAVKSLIKTSILTFLKSQLSPDVEKFMAQLAEYMSDGIITPWEQMNLDKMADEMDKKAENYLGQVDKYVKDSSTQKETAGGFETMSQDTADELNGRFTALYESNLRIEGQINIGNIALDQMRYIATETRDMVQSCYQELIDIRDNTGAVVSPIKQMQKDMSEMKNVIKERL